MSDEDPAAPLNELVTPMSDEELAAPLYKRVARIIERHQNQDQIEPSWLATEAMLELDPERATPPIIFQLCHLQLTQIAQELCRGKFKNAGAPAECEI